MSPWRLLLTRPSEDCAVMAEALAAQGVYSHGLPLLAIEPLPETAEVRARVLDLDTYQVLIVFSKPAAHLAWQWIDRYWPQLPVGLQWFAVGPGTGAVLADYGIAAHWPAEGSSEALLRLPELAKALAQPNARVLLCCGEGGRELVAETLRDGGADVDQLHLYRRELPAHATDALPRCVREQGLNGLVVSSGQGLQHLRQLCGEDWSALSQLPLFVPSDRVAGLAHGLGFSRVIACHGASVEALLKALQNQAPQIINDGYPTRTRRKPT